MDFCDFARDAGWPIAKNNWMAKAEGESFAGLESEAAIIGHLRTVDALLLVIGLFQDGSTADSAIADVAALEGTFILSDLEVVDRRVERLDREVRMARGADTERQVKARELVYIAHQLDIMGRAG